ncbi:MAG: ClpX C4-type zinc finger protein [Pyrinomonadaceae bacterium]
MLQEKIKSNLFRCSFCGKTQNEVNNMIAGPKGNICDHCTVGFLSLPKMTDVSSVQNAICNFCGKSKQEVGAFSGREQVQICSGCLDVCQEIIGSNLQTADARK